MRGVFFFIMFVGVWASLGCGSQSMPVTHFEDILKHIAPSALEPPTDESQFNFGCEDHLKLIAYVKDNHVLAHQLRVEPFLKKSLEKIILKGKLPVPFFYTNTDHTRIINTHNTYVTPDHLITYVEFHLSPIQAREVEDDMSQFTSMASFCSSVESVANVIKDASNVKQQLTSKKLTSLLHKGILRYFIESLDPHSRIYDWIELAYSKDNLNNQLLLERDEHLFPLLSQNDPYLVEDGEPSISRKWIQDSSILDIELTAFNEKTDEDFSRLYMEAYSEKNIKGLVIDLRRNHGGNALVVANLADRFIKEGSVLLIHLRNEGQWQPMILDAISGNELPRIDNIPVVVLVSRHSASSSETFSAAMKDHQAAVIIGERTFGKGTGQRSDYVYKQPISLKQHFHLTLSILYTFTPRGIPIQDIGIVPDIELKDYDYTRMIPKDYEAQYLAMREDKFYTNHLANPGSILKVDYRENTSRKERIGAWIDRLQKYFSKQGNIFTLNDFAEALE